MVQSRYGWTDEILHELGWPRFIELARLSADFRREEGKERLVIAAFIGHQLGAGGKKTFKTYLNDLGLSGDAPESVAPVYNKKASDARLKSRGIVAKKGKH